MIHSFSYFWGKIFDRHGHKTFSLIQNNILHQSKNYKNHFENSNFWGIWPLSNVGHVTYSFINMLFISTGIFDDDIKLNYKSLRGNGGIAVFWKKTIDNAVKIKSDGGSRIQVITINNIPTMLCIVNVYMPSDIKEGNYEYRDMMDQLNEVIQKYEETYTTSYSVEIWMLHYIETTDEGIASLRSLL